MNAPFRSRLDFEERRTGEGGDTPDDASEPAAPSDGEEPANAIRRRLRHHPRLLHLVEMTRQCAHAAKDDRVTGLAAEVAFFALLSIFPGLLAVAAGLGTLDSLFGAEVAERAQREVIAVLTTFLTARADGTVDAIRSLFENASAGVLTFGVLGALWSASRGMATVLSTLSAVYDYKETRTRLRRRVVALGLAFASMVLVVVTLAMLVLGPLFGAARAVAAAVGLDAEFGAVWGWVGLPIAFLALLGWAAVVFHSVPHPHVTWWYHLAGAAVTGVLWLIVSIGFRVYLALFGGNPVFGVLGGSLVVLLWLYLLSLALLIGAETNAVLGQRRLASTPETESSPGTGRARS